MTPEFAKTRHLGYERAGLGATALISTGRLPDTGAGR
jgi:hypothetical protein